MAENSKKTAPGRPFQKGQSGNPGGRPKVAETFKQDCRAFMTAEGWDKLQNMARNDRNRDQWKAIELIAAYAYGRPRQGIDLDAGEGGLVIKVKVIEDE